MGVLSAAVARLLLVTLQTIISAIPSIIIIHRLIIIEYSVYSYSSNGDIVLESLSALDELDYPNYEVIIVDNASRDESFEKIKEFVQGKSRLRKTTRIIRSDINLGFTGERKYCIQSA